MFRKIKENLLEEDGQTMVEYILLVAVVVVICINIFEQLNNYLLNDPDSFQNRYLNSYRSLFQGNNASFSGQYKYFTIRR